MAFEIKDFSVLSSDKIHTLKGKLYVPNGEIKGLFHLVHGMTEHIGRYSSFFDTLAENGYKEVILTGCISVIVISLLLGVISPLFKTIFKR